MVSQSGALQGVSRGLTKLMKTIKTVAFHYKLRKKLIKITQGSCHEIVLLSVWDLNVNYCKRAKSFSVAKSLSLKSLKMDMLSVEENHNSRNIQVRIRQQKLQSGKHSVSTGQTLVQVCGMKSMKPAFLKRHLKNKTSKPGQKTSWMFQGRLLSLK